MAKELTYIVMDEPTIASDNVSTALQNLLQPIHGGDLELRAVRLFEATPELMNPLFSTFAYEQELGTSEKVDLAYNAFMKSYLISHDFKRIMVLIFEGTDAVKEVRQMMGSHLCLRGTLRYRLGGRCTFSKTGKTIKDYNPAVFLPYDAETALEGIRLFSQHHILQPAILPEGKIDWNSEFDMICIDPVAINSYLERISKLAGLGETKLTMGELKETEPQRTIFMVKPPLMGETPYKAGSFLDFIAGHGINGIKLVGTHYSHMTVGQFIDFYGQLKGTIPQTEYIDYCRQFTGFTPDADPLAKTEDARHAYLAFVLEGPFVTHHVRKYLGPTNPDKAGNAHMRKGAESIGRNFAHATDTSQGRYGVEARILNFSEPVIPRVSSRYVA